METYVHLWYLAQFFLEWKMLKKKGVEKIETHILYPATFVPNKVQFMWQCGKT
jgi:hypothetical protein